MTNLSNVIYLEAGAPEDKESAERPKTISERPVMCDVSCQTEYDMTDDEPAEAAVVDEPENLCEGNPDAKFHPLILKHQGVFTYLQGMRSQFYDYYLNAAFLLNRIISGSLLWSMPLDNSSCELLVETSRGDFRNQMRSMQAIQKCNQKQSKLIAQAATAKDRVMWSF